MSSSTTIPVGDSAWAARFSQGDWEAFSRLHEFHAPQLLAFLCSKCRGRISPDDIAQEVWMRIWKARQSFDGSNFRAWMFQITRNHLVTEYRKKQEDLIPETYEAPANPEPEESEMGTAMKDCLKLVGGDFVEVLNAQLEGKTTEQIAVQFNIKSATVYTRVDRAKKLIRECVQKKLA